MAVFLENRGIMNGQLIGFFATEREMSSVSVTECWKDSKMATSTKWLFSTLDGGRPSYLNTRFQAVGRGLKTPSAQGAGTLLRLTIGGGEGAEKEGPFAPIKGTKGLFGVDTINRPWDLERSWRTCNRE